MTAYEGILAKYWEMRGRAVLRVSRMRLKKK